MAQPLSPVGEASGWWWRDDVFPEARRRTIFEKPRQIPYPWRMNASHHDSVTILHNKVPARIRFSVPLIKHKRTLAEILKQSLFKDLEAKGIYHAEPNIVTGSLLVKYHPAFHSEDEVVRLVRRAVENLADGEIEISAKHRNPRLGKMAPRAFFTRELIVSVCGNILAGVILAAIVSP